MVCSLYLCAKLLKSEVNELLRQCELLQTLVAHLLILNILRAESDNYMCDSVLRVLKRDCSNPVLRQKYCIFIAM